MGYMRSSRVYEPIYTVKNLYNNFITLQNVFLMWKLSIGIINKLLFMT